MITALLAQLRDEVSWVAGAQTKDNEPLDIRAGIVSCGPLWNHRSATIETDGDLPVDIAVPAKVFADWLSTQRGSKAILQLEGGRLTAIARGTCRLPLLELSDRPSLPEPAHWFHADGELFRLALAGVGAHDRGSVESAQVWERSVHLSANQVFGGSPYSTALVGPSGGAEDRRVQVDRKQLREALTGATGPVTMERSDSVNLIWVSHGGRRTRIGTQQYGIPDMTRLFDQGRECCLEVDSVELLAAVKSVSVETDVIDLFGDSEWLGLVGTRSTRDLDPLGLASARVGYTGNQLTRRIDAGFLSGALSTISGMARIHWSDTTPRRPLLIESDDSEVRHCIATIRTE